MRVSVNLRVVSGAQGGQQRVAAEIARRLDRMVPLRPHGHLAGFKGHAWEQAVLPFLARGTLLWSPSASGPLLVRNQVVTIHDVAFIDVPQYFSAKFARFYTALTSRLSRRVAKVVTVSEYSRRRLIEAYGLDPERVVSVANGVSATFRRYDEADIARVRAKLGLPARYVLLQGTSDRRKNVAAALQAWRVAQERVDPSVELVVSGHLGRAHVFGSDATQVEPPPRTRMIGFVDEEDIGPLTAGAEAFLFPSLYEGFGLPIIEAMACGAPVLTSNVTAMPEVAGDAAVLVDPTDVADMAAGMTAVLTDSDLRARLTAAGLARASGFTWDAAAAAYADIFRSLGGEV